MAKPLNEIINDLIAENEKLRAELRREQCPPSALYCRCKLKHYQTTRGGAPA